jgi:hypothetical protein
MEQLKVCTNDFPSVVKKKVIAASVSSTEAFPTAGLALQLEVPTAAAASILGQKVGVLKLCPGWPTGGGSGQYPPEGGGGQYVAGGDSGGHIGGYPATGDPPHGITGVGPV